MFIGFCSAKLVKNAAARKIQPRFRRERLIGLNFIKINAMKKQLLLLVTLLPFAAHAQVTYQILDVANTNITGTSQTVNITSTTQATMNYTIKNTASQAKTTRMFKLELATVAGSWNTYTFDQYQYMTSVDTSLHTVSILANGITGFASIYNPMGGVGTTSLNYCAYEDANPSNMACIVIYYNSQPSGTAEYLASGFSAFPNPANEELVLKFDATADVLAGTSISFCDPAGKTVKTIAAGTLASSQTVSLSELAAGIYYYTVYYEGAKITTQKLVVL